MGLGFFHFQALFLLSATLLNFTPFRISSVSATTFSNFTVRLALLDFKSKIIHDPQNIFGSWNDSLHFCQWQGVRCGRRHERVTVLKLESSGLVGSISPALGNLSFLWGLDLSNNTLQGKIPDGLGRLFRLQILVLNNNSFVGEIPGNLSHCSKLDYLGLASNNLVGKIPAELVSLSKLEKLVIHKNNLSGAIPPFIGNLTSLNSISAAANNFQGRIPDTLGQLKNLESLGLGTNFLSEYGLGSQVSIYGDIYSYGILLLEMITGKRPTDNMFEGTLNLHGFARMALPEQVLNIVDPSLLSSGNVETGRMSNMSLENPTSSSSEIGTLVECVTSLIEIGLSCSRELPQDRLEISHAITELCSIRKILQ